MRPFVSCFTFVSFFLAAALVVARTETISSPDKRILFQGSWKNIAFPGGSISFIRRDSGNATLTVFNASQISVTVMVEFPGDMVRILLDSVGHDVFPTTSQVPAWNSTILDPNVPHTVTVIKMNSKTRYTLLYSFLVTYPGSPEDTPSSDLPTIATTSAPSNTGATSTVVIVGTLVSAVCLGLLGALGFYLWRRRRKPDATLNPFRKVEGRTSLFQSVDALHARMVKTETDGARRNGSPNGGTYSAPEGRPAGEDTSAFILEGTAPSQPPPGSPSGHLSAPPPYVNNTPLYRISSTPVIPDGDSEFHQVVEFVATESNHFT